MTNRSKLALAALAVAVAGVTAVPLVSTAMAGQLAANKIAVMAPAAPDALGTIWFDVDGTQGSGVSFGGRH